MQVTLYKVIASIRIQIWRRREMVNGFITFTFPGSGMLL